MVAESNCSQPLSGLVETPGAYRLDQGIALEPQLLGDGGGLYTIAEQFLRRTRSAPRPDNRRNF